MKKIATLDKTIAEYCEDFQWVKPKDIVVAHWVRMKCLFGCPSYGQVASCPPNLPDITECRRFFREYGKAVLLRFEKQVKSVAEKNQWTRRKNIELLKLEREVFLAGFPKTFLLHLDECRLCKECSETRTTCKNKLNSRPSPEGMGVDVFETARRFGFPIEVLQEKSETMNRFAILLIE